MKLNIPDIGTPLILDQDWQITLYAEYRNKSLFDLFKIPFKTTIVELPKGLVIKLDRIYIKKGLPQYSSLTFSCPKPKNKLEKEKYPHNLMFSGSKFWVKLHECNGLEISNLESNEETILAIKGLYDEMEKDIINNGNDVYQSTNFLKIFNSYLGTGLSLNNLYTKLTPDEFMNSMIVNISKSKGDKGSDYFVKMIRLYLRDYKLNRILE